MKLNILKDIRVYPVEDVLTVDSMFRGYINHHKYMRCKPFQLEYNWAMWVKPDNYHREILFQNSSYILTKMSMRLEK